jgi:hypothetical protein
VTPGAGVRIAQGYVSQDQLQDLADIIGDVANAAVGHDLKIMVQIEVGGEGKSPPEQVVAKINGKISGILGELRLG